MSPVSGFYAFARSIQNDLVHAGLLRAERGARGGLALACDPSTTTLLHVLECVQGPISMTACTNDERFCDRRDGCEFHAVWKHAESMLKASYCAGVAFTRSYVGYVHAMAHAVTTNLCGGYFNTAALAGNALEANAFVLTAGALPVP